MKLSVQLSTLAVAANLALAATTGPQFKNGQPSDGNGRGGPLLGMWNVHSSSDHL